MVWLICDHYYFIVEIILSGIVSTAGHMNRNSAVFCSCLMVQTLHSCKGRNVGSIRFKYYLAVLLVASRYLFLMPQCPQGILSRKVLATCLPVPGETGMGCWLSTHCYIPVSTTTRETKQSSSELPFELFVTLKLTKYSETQSLFYREQHLSARQGARTETCRTACELLHVRGRNLCSFNT